MPSFSEIKKTKRQIKCKQCGSEEVWRNGKEKDIQYFRCKNCDYRFSGIDTYPTYHYEKEIINQAFTYAIRITITMDIDNFYFLCLRIFYCYIASCTHISPLLIPLYPRAPDLSTSKFFSCTLLGGPTRLRA